MPNDPVPNLYSMHLLYIVSVRNDERKINKLIFAGMINYSINVGALSSTAAREEMPNIYHRKSHISKQISIKSRFNM